jgi:hypothetical protein
MHWSGLLLATLALATPRCASHAESAPVAHKVPGPFGPGEKPAILRIVVPRPDEAEPAR